MNKEFIPYEQALELIKLGFDEECLAVANVKSYELKIIKGEYNKELHLPIPLYQQAFRWFREKYKLLGLPKPYGYEIQYNAELHYWGTIIEKEANTYEEAELACLKKLIEIVKNK
ncbi:conserved hypothetical protein [Gammaproteobacteria bacterium]